MRRFHWLLIAAAAGTAGAWFAWPSAGSRGDRPHIAPFSSPLPMRSHAESPTPPSFASDRKPVAVVLGSSEHIFGTIDPSQKCEHLFTIRNEGQSDLQLSAGRTTCKCTVSEPPKEPVPPGGEARVRVAARVQLKEGPFSQIAELVTNDPDHPTIQLRIAGTIRRYLSADPDRIVLAKLKRSETHETEVLIYSQVWDDFELPAVRSSLAGVTWKVEPADPAALAKLDGRSGYRLRVTLPKDVPGGNFWEWLEVSGRPARSEEPPRTFRVDITGDVLTRFTLAGRRLVPGPRVIEFGGLHPGEGAKERLVLKIRDDHPVLTVQGIETEPDFLRVDVDPLVPGKESSGLYSIVVEVPRDAPASNYLSGKTGKVRIMTDHPKLPILNIGVAFAVATQ